MTFNYLFECTALWCILLIEMPVIQRYQVINAQIFLDFSTSDEKVHVLMYSKEPDLCYY